MIISRIKTRWVTSPAGHIFNLRCSCGRATPWSAFMRPGITYAVRCFYADTSGRGGASPLHVGLDADWLRLLFTSACRVRCWLAEAALHRGVAFALVRSDFHKLVDSLALHCWGCSTLRGGRIIFWKHMYGCKISWYNIIKNQTMVQIK